MVTNFCLKEGAFFDFKKNSTVERMLKTMNRFRPSALKMDSEKLKELYFDYDSPLAMMNEPPPQPSRKEMLKMKQKKM